MSQKPLQIAVLISGNGSNLQAIIDAIDAGQVNAKILAVVSNRPDAYGLERAKRHHIPQFVLNHKEYSDRKSYDQQLRKLLDDVNPDLIALAGFMRILSDDFVTHFTGKLINIHPSLLPKYPGLNTHEKVITNGDKEHGCSIHYVTAELDGGPVIRQAHLDVLPGDTAASLQQRVHQLEHQLYPEVIQWLAEQNKLFTR